MQNGEGEYILRISWMRSNDICWILCGHDIREEFRFLSFWPPPSGENSVIFFPLK